MILSIDRLKKTYDMGGENVVHALGGVDLTVEKGEFMAIMGPSGSGKSTLLNMIGCLDRPDSGAISIDGVDVTMLPARKLPEIRGGKVGFIFQTFNLVPALTAVENVELPMHYAGIGGKKARQRAMEVLAEVGLEDRAKHFPTELSGGQAQRVSIARALALEPAIILADEPTGQLDTKSSEMVMDMLRELNLKKGQTFIIVTHDPVVGSATDRIVHMVDGLVESDEASGTEASAPTAALDDREPATVASGRDGNGHLEQQMERLVERLDDVIDNLAGARRS